MPRPPVIVIGMHRSGTSMTTRLLDQLGLFVGWRLQPDHEALFFVYLNEWLLQQSGGSWEHPRPIRDLIANREVRPLVADYLRYSLGTPRSVSYLGFGRYLRHRDVPALGEPWGWKDPRNTFTLPLWLDLFPDARVLHVHRHGVDVAASLVTRHARVLEQRKARYVRMRAQYLLRSKQVGFTTTLRCTSLEGGLALWDEYMQEARAHVATLGERAMEVRYESLLENPVEELDAVARFCGLMPERPAIERLTSQLRAGRGFAYRQSESLRAFAERNRERLTAHGY